MPAAARRLMKLRSSVRVSLRRVPLAEWRTAYEKRPGDVKTVLQFED